MAIFGFDGQKHLVKVGLSITKSGYKEQGHICLRIGQTKKRVALDFPDD